MDWPNSPLVDRALVDRGYTATEGKLSPTGTLVNVPGPPVQAGYSFTPTPEETAQLADFRKRESGGNYKAVNKETGDASGGYQMIDSTWKRWSEAAGYGGKYTKASDAPPEIQDAVALYGYRKEGKTPWAASEPGWPTGNVIKSGKWQVADRAIAYEQGRNDNQVFWGTGGQLNDLLKAPDDDKISEAKRRSLRRSLALGSDIDAIPEIEVKPKGNRLVVTDTDGWHRVQEAIKEGVDLVPFAVHGAGQGKYTEIEGPTGKVIPFDFKPVAKIEGAGSQFDPTGASAKFYSGVRTQLVEGPAQFLTKSLPESVVTAITSFNEYLSKQGVPLGKIPSEESQRQREAELQKSGTAGSLPYMAGEMAGTLPMAALGPGGAGVGAALARGAVQGAAGAAMSPVTSGDFWWEKGKQAATGAAGGAIVGAGGEFLARAIAPMPFRQKAQALLDEGVTLTPGMLAGGGAKKAEDAVTSIPILGQAVQSGQRRAIESFNRVAWNRVLKPLGMELPKNIPVGREAAEFVNNAIDSAYNNIIPNLKGQADKQFVTELKDIAQRARSSLPDAQFGHFGRIIRSQLLEKTSAPADGGALKGIDSELGRLAKGYRSDPSFDNRQLGHFIDDLHASFRHTLERQNPQYSAALKNANEAYANYVRVSRAAASSGAKDGVFTPAQLSNAVRASDPTLRKMGFAKGGALMQDLSDAAKDVLPRNYPDSGTATRLITAGLLGAAGGEAYHQGLIGPKELAMAGAMSLPFTKPGMALLREWATAAPKTRNLLAEIPRFGSRMAAPSGAGMVVPGNQSR